MRRLALSLFMVLCATTAVFWVTPSTVAAPLAQVLLPNFILRADTTITVTVALADGQTVRVPVALTFNARHEVAGGYITLDAHVEQQPNLFIAVDDSAAIDAALQAIVYTTPTPAPVAVAPTVPPVVVPVATATAPPPPPRSHL